MTLSLTKCQHLLIQLTLLLRPEGEIAVAEQAEELVPAEVLVLHVPSAMHL